jgi:hypothetical protein
LLATGEAVSWTRDAARYMLSLPASASADTVATVEVAF